MKTNKKSFDDEKKKIINNEADSIVPASMLKPKKIRSSIRNSRSEETVKWSDIPIQIVSKTELTKPNIPKLINNPRKTGDEKKINELINNRNEKELEFMTKSEKNLRKVHTNKTKNLQSNKDIIRCKQGKKATRKLNKTSEKKIDLHKSLKKETKKS